MIKLYGHRESGECVADEYRRKMRRTPGILRLLKS